LRALRVQKYSGFLMVPVTMRRCACY